MIAADDPLSQARETPLPGGRIATCARNVLEQHPIFRGRSQLIHIEEDAGRLILEGRLPSYYLKQMLQTVLRDVDGVGQIDNRVRVDWPVTPG